MAATASAGHDRLAYAKSRKLRSRREEHSQRISDWTGNCNSPLRIAGGHDGDDTSIFVRVGLRDDMLGLSDSLALLGVHAWDPNILLISLLLKAVLYW